MHKVAIGEGIPLGFADMDIVSGSHIALVYQSEHERQEALLGYLAAGLQNREKCIAALLEYPSDLWADELRSRGVDEDLLSGNQLQTITAAGLYELYGDNSVAHASAALADAINSSFAQGWRSVRICTSYMHLFCDQNAAQELLMADSGLNGAVEEMNITALCTFSKSRLHPGLIEACTSLHTHLTDGTTLSANSHYLDHQQLVHRLPELMQDLQTSGALADPLVRLDFIGEIPIIRVGEEMDLFIAPRMQELAEWVADMGHRMLVVDLSATGYMDAASIRALILSGKAMQGTGGRLAVYDPTRNRRIFEIVRLGEFMDIHPELEDALRAVTEGAG